MISIVSNLNHFYHPSISVDISAFCSTSSASSARVIVGPTRPPQHTNSSDSRQSSSSTSYEKSNQSKSQLKASSQGAWVSEWDRILSSRSCACWLFVLCNDHLEERAISMLRYAMLCHAMQINLINLTKNFLLNLRNRHDRTLWADI